MGDSNRIISPAEAEASACLCDLVVVSHDRRSVFHVSLFPLEALGEYCWPELGIAVRGDVVGATYLWLCDALASLFARVRIALDGRAARVPRWGFDFPIHYL